MRTVHPQSKISELLAKIRAAKLAGTASIIAQAAAEVAAPVPPQEQEAPAPFDQPADQPADYLVNSTDRFGKAIAYNERQQEFIKLAARGRSCVLIGAAGTGKTTCMKGAVTALILSGVVGTLNSEGHKHLLSGTPGLVVVAYTRRATNNIRNNMPKDLQNNCITIHKLLQYEPVFFDILDPVTGKMRSTMRFEPTKNRRNPLPSSIDTIIVEESSMVGRELHEEVVAACPHAVQFIYLGDIQQLPPVFGPAILGFKMLELPVVELTEVYRQALESPIIRLAHRILSGKAVPASEYPAWSFPGQLTIHPWSKKIREDLAVKKLSVFFQNAYKLGQYDPTQDIILMPFNKGCGTLELNRHIAQFLALKRGADVYEVIAGFNKHYFSIGETILFDKEDAEIVDIYRNPKYLGKTPQHHSKTLDYWGAEQGDAMNNDDEVMTEEEMADALLALADENEDRTNESSHIIKVRLANSDREILLSSSGAVNAILLGYALTVHKAQGSEWRRVFFIAHQSHATMIQREFLYTAVTRAREELYVICEPDTFTKGIENQRIPGNTWQEKAEVFKGKLDA